MKKSLSKKIFVFSLIIFGLGLFGGSVNAKEVGECTCVLIYEGNEYVQVMGDIDSESECDDFADIGVKTLGITTSDGMFMNVEFIVDECLWSGPRRADPEPVEEDDIAGQLQGKSAVLNPLKIGSVSDLLGRLVKIIMSIIGSIAFAMFIYGGFLWMTARGNSDQEGQSWKILLWSSLGLVVILASYAIVKFIFESAL